VKVTPELLRQPNFGLAVSKFARVDARKGCVAGLDRPSYFRLFAATLLQREGLSCRRFAFGVSLGRNADGCEAATGNQERQVGIRLPGGISRSDPKERRSLSVAAERETQCATYFRHSVGREAGYALTQALLRDGHRIVKIHGTERLHAIFFIQPHFRGNASDCRGDRRHRRCRQVSKGAIAGQHDNRPGFVRRGEAVKPNIAPRYSSGQIASASQVDRLLEPLGAAS
jgi:hypothetical protein